MNYPIRNVQFFGEPFKIYDTRPRWPFDDQEPPMLKYWPRIGLGDVVVDVGSAVGVYSLTALAMGAGQVIMVEPSQELGEILLANLDLNRDAWKGGWEFEACALDDGGHPDAVAIPEALVSEVFTRHYPATGVQWRTLDSIMGGCKVHFAKIDVEGMELAVLMGSLEMLTRWRPTLIVEDHEGFDPGNVVSDYPKSIDSSRRIQAMLRELGYAIEIMPHGGGGRQYICAEHKERP